MACPVMAQSTSPGAALKEVVVTASRTEQRVRDALPSTTLISRADIERSQAFDLPALLRNVTGMEVAQNGGPGTLASVFIRGAESRHTLVLIDGVPVHSWRNIPLLPCPHLPLTEARTSTILALRLGAENQGVVGLRPADLPDQHEPGLNVRFMGINERAVARYLVSAYQSLAMLIPDAAGALENVEVGH